MVSRTLTLVYGVASYVFFVLVFVYAIGFVGNVGVPRGIDGPLEGSLLAALGLDLVLLTIFAVQHSVMARRGFKAWWTRIVPEAVERSTFVLAASACLALTFWQWRPLGGVVWQVDAPSVRVALHALSAFGWLTVLATTFLINHFELFGLAQVWRHFRGTTPQFAAFVMPGPYRQVRHPLYLGFIIAFWAAPTMSATHLMFAAVTTAYILVAIQFEERDLIVAHPEYAAYRRRVPMLVPSMRRGETHSGVVAAAASQK
jgi:protein-S-isoprenylcysteine O-methyltransferase Ste14